MNKKNWSQVGIAFFLSWGFDRITKELATHLTSAHFIGIFGVILHYNRGAMLGMFSDLPVALRVVSLSTGGAFMLFLFAILQYILPTKSMKLRLGLAFLIAGITGNVTDRILSSAVTDFMVIGTPRFHSPVFNFADVIQWFGYILICVAFVLEGAALWPAENLRKSYWINRRFQLKYCLMLSACGLGLTLVLGTYSYTFLKISLSEAHLVDGASFLTPFVITFAVVSLTFCAVLFVIGLILSHRAAGPVYAFERFLNDTIEGKNPNFKLRLGDEFQELERVAARLKSELSPRSSRTKSG